MPSSVYRRKPTLTRFRIIYRAGEEKLQRVMDIETDTLGNALVQLQTMLDTEKIFEYEVIRVFKEINYSGLKNTIRSLQKYGMLRGGTKK